MHAEDAALVEPTESRVPDAASANLKAFASQPARALAWFSLGLGVAELAAPAVIARLIGARGTRRNQRLLRAFGLREIGSGLGILSDSDSPRWAWSRVLGDAVDLALLGRILKSRHSTRSRTLAVLAVIAGVSVLDALTAVKLTRNA